MTGTIHQDILNSGFKAQLPDQSEEGVKKALEDLAQPHSGVKVFQRAMIWAVQE